MDAASAKTTYVPNAINLGLQKTYGQMVNPLSIYTYDSAGNELTQTDAKGNITTFSYDSLGNQIARTLPDGQSEHDTYDGDGRKI